MGLAAWGRVTGLVVDRIGDEEAGRICVGCAGRRVEAELGDGSAEKGEIGSGHSKGRED